MPDEKPFRVAILHSSDRESVILNHDLQLPSGHIEPKENFEHAAQRIARACFDLEHLSAVARISPSNGVEGYVLEACTGRKTDLRRTFAGRAFELDFLLKDADEHPDKYRQTDIAILQAYSDQTFRK